MDENNRNLKKAEAIIAGVSLAAAAVSTVTSIYIVGKSISVLRKMGKALDLYIEEHKYIASECGCCVPLEDEDFSKEDDLVF